ncbi:MAG: DUF58 domain-containing protein [Acidobacteriota bacterium]
MSWREVGRSLAATLALGLALGSALASSVAAREGNLGTAVLLAAFALLLAGVIALTAVPRLLQRVRREWPVWSFSITREGWVFVLFTLTIAAAAFNTGNNLIFIVLAAVLATLFVSELASHLNLRRLSLKVDLPPVAVAEEPFYAVFHLKNLKPRLPSFSVSMEYRERSPDRRRILFTGSDFASIFGGGRAAYYPFLPGGTQSYRHTRVCLPRRGRYRQPAVHISSGFPFGLVRKRTRAVVDLEVIALPPLSPVNAMGAGLPALAGAFESLRRGTGTNLYSIRDYQERDNARFLDWKATAKTSVLKVRELSLDEERKCTLVLDNRFSHPQPPDFEAFEEAVKLCANTARALHNLGCAIRLATPAAETPFSESAEGLLEALKILALIEVVEGTPSGLEAFAGDRAFKLVFTSEPDRIPVHELEPGRVVGIRTKPI